VSCRARLRLAPRCVASAPSPAARSTTTCEEQGKGRWRASCAAAPACVSSRRIGSVANGALYTSRAGVVACLAQSCLLAGGFPRVLFPPLWCFPPRCAGAVPPCDLLTPRIALLSWDHLAGLRASPRQTWAGSSLAAAGAPQLHASALQQIRRLAHRPAHVTAFLCCDTSAM